MVTYSISKHTGIAALYPLLIAHLDNFSSSKPPVSSGIAHLAMLDYSPYILLYPH